MRTRLKLKLEKLKDVMAQELGHENLAKMADDGAICSWDGVSARNMKRALARMEKAFEKAGGRGPEDAEGIDDLRVAIAARQVCRSGTALKLFDDAQEAT